MPHAKSVPFALIGLFTLAFVPPARGGQLFNYIPPADPGYANAGEDIFSAPLIPLTQTTVTSPTRLELTTVADASFLDVLPGAQTGGGDLYRDAETHVESSGVAEFGRLSGHALAASHAFNNQLFAPQFFPAAGSGYVDHRMVANETVTLTSKDLASGSAATFDLALDLHVIRSHTGVRSSVVAGARLDVIAPSGTYFIDLLSPSFAGDGEYILHNTLAVPASVGDTVTFSFSMQLNAQSYAYIGEENSRGFIDARDTATFYATPRTPGVQMIGESGHDYTLNPVPEPATAASLAFAAAVFLFRRRDRRGH